MRIKKAHEKYKAAREGRVFVGKNKKKKRSRISSLKIAKKYL